MFGYEYEIVKEYPNYFLDYQEQLDENNRWTDRIVSSSGDWSGNLYDFYFRVYNKIVQDVKIPFKLEGGDRIADAPVHKALRVALANCLINADYYGRQGIVVIKRKDSFLFSNPGDFRIGVEAAKSGDNDKKTILKTELQKEAIIEYLTEKVTIKAVELEELLGVNKSRARKLLSELIEADIILAEGANRNRVYKLK